jgi:hypothetical protein
MTAVAVEGRADAPLAAAGPKLKPNYVVTIEDNDSEEARQRTQAQQQRKFDYCCFACVIMIALGATAAWGLSTGAL